MFGQQQNPDYIPKTVAGFNFPKSVIEAKVDVLTLLELLVRKGLVSDEEIDEVRGAVVAHLNVLYPDLKLSYSTPAPLSDQAPLPTQNASNVPLYAAAAPPANLLG